MFSIVSMQDVLINLNGGEELFKKFDRTGRSRKRSTSVKSPVRKESPFSIQNIWILPSHVLVLSGEASNATLLAYNQYPKMSYLTTDRVIDLLQPAKEKGSTCGVFDVFCKLTDQEYIFVLLKNGSIIAWQFKKPLFEYFFLGYFTLCKGKGCQLTSYSYNEEMIMWCEKRSTSQCCVCVTTVHIIEEKVSISNTRTILHNCLPMLIHPIKKSHFCLLPSANRPPGLILFWNCKNDDLSVRVWKDGLLSHRMGATSSDFQNIITSSIPLWINSSSTDQLFVTMTTHSTTKELIFLQQDLSFYLVTSEEDLCRLKCVKFCNLEVNEEKESFAKRILKIYLWHRLVLLNMLDGELLIFDSRNGLFLWKSETFKLNSPKVWVCMGPFPSIGVWNKSGIWTFRPKPIREQVKEIHADFQDEVTSPPAAKTLPDITDVDHAVTAIGEQKKEASNKVRRRIKQGVNRKSKLPIGYMFQVLNKWKSERTSSELALHLMMKHIKSMKCVDDDDDDSILTSNELVELLSHIYDPVLLMALFTNKALPTAVKRHLVSAVNRIIESPLVDNINPQIMNILKEYLNIEDQIESCYFINKKSDDDDGDDSLEFILKYEQEKLMASNTATFENVFRHFLEIYPNYVTGFIIPTLMTEDVNDEIWHTLLSKQSTLLYKLIPVLWQENPLYLFDFLEAAFEKIKEYHAENLLSLEGLIEISLSLIHLNKTSTSNVSLKEKSFMEGSVIVYCKLLLLHKKDYSEKCCEIYLRHDMIDKAIDLLNENNSSTFLTILEYLLEKNILKSYVDRILPFIPKHQNVTEMCNILLTNSQDLNPGNIYLNNSAQLDMEAIKPIFEVLFKKDES